MMTYINRYNKDMKKYVDNYNSNYMYYLTTKNEIIGILIRQMDKP